MKGIVTLTQFNRTAKTSCIFSDDPVVEYQDTIEDLQFYRLSVQEGEAKVKFSGKVLQVIEDTDRNQMRLAIDSDYDKVILVSYEEDRNNRVLEDDILTVYGYFNGIRTYTTVLGDERSIPFINANMIQQ